MRGQLSRTATDRATTRPNFAGVSTHSCVICCTYLESKSVWLASQWLFCLVRNVNSKHLVFTATVIVHLFQIGFEWFVSHGEHINTMLPCRQTSSILANKLQYLHLDDARSTSKGLRVLCEKVDFHRTGAYHYHNNRFWNAGSEV